MINTLHNKTNEELRLDVALALGWTLWKNKGAGFVFAINGRTPSLALCEPASVDQISRVDNNLNILLRVSGVPDYTGSVDACDILLRQLRDEFKQVNITGATNFWWVIYTFVDSEGMPAQCVVAEESLARAICIAYLSWRLFPDDFLVKEKVL